MKDTGLIEELLFNVQVIAPVTSLQKSGVIEARFDDATHSTQKNKDEEYRPADCLSKEDTMSRRIDESCGCAKV